jgi:hypothetical protein
MTSYEVTEKVIFTDRSLANKVRVVAISQAPARDGKIKAYVELESRSSKNMVVLIQTQFRDDLGRLSQDATNWRAVVMAPNSVTAYECTSMNDKARDFVIRVKLGKEH